MSTFDVVVTIAGLVFLLAGGVLLLTLLSGINDWEFKDEHEDGGF